MSQVEDDELPALEFIGDLDDSLHMQVLSSDTVLFSARSLFLFAIYDTFTVLLVC